MNTELIRTQLKAVIAMAESILLALGDEEEECRHPVDERIDISTMGNKRWMCNACGYTYGMEEGE